MARESSKFLVIFSLGLCKPCNLYICFFIYIKKKIKKVKGFPAVFSTQKKVLGLCEDWNLREMGGLGAGKG